MTPIQRYLIALALGFASCFGAMAQGSYPAKPIRIIVPYSPGGATDSLTRQIAGGLQSELGATVIVDNKPGGNTIVGAQALVNAPADGYTLMMVDPATVTQVPHLYRKLPFDPSALLPVGTVSRITMSFLVPKDSPANSLNEFVTYANAREGKLSYGSSSAGNVTHLGMEMFLARSGIKMVHVPYKGTGPALTDLIGGQIDAFITDVASAKQYVASGKLKMLAVMTPRRSPLLPEVPTFEESGYPGLSVNVWYGLLAPRGTPPQSVEKLDAAISKIVVNPSVRDWMTTAHLEPYTTTPAEFASVIAADSEKWRQVIQGLNLLLD